MAEKFGGNGAWKLVLVEMAASSQNFSYSYGAHEYSWLVSTDKGLQKCTYKCLAFRRRSRPGVKGVETGIGPVNWLSAKSSQ